MDDILKETLPVKAPPSSPSDKLRRKLTPKLSPEVSKDLAQCILRDFNAAIQDRQEWENRLAEWDDAYYNRAPDKLFPWEGAANFHVPLTMMGVETYKPRLVEAVLGQTPPIIVVPTTGGGEQRKDLVECFLNWQVQTQLDLEPVVTDSAHVFLQPGLAVVKTTWQVIRTRRKSVREFPADTPLPAIWEALFGDEQPRDLMADLDTGLSWTGTLPTTSRGGVPLEVKIEMAMPEPEDGQDPMIQVLVDREEAIERPMPEVVDPIDIIAPAKGGKSIGDLPWMQHRQWWTEDELRRRVLLKQLDAEAVEAVLQSGTPKGDKPTTDSTAYREGKDAAEGIEGYGPSNVRREQYQILEDYRRYDIDDDGFEEEIIVWVSPDNLEAILGWDYLDNAYAHGRRPFRKECYHPIPFRFLGLSYAEVIKGIQDEINTIHNQRVDYGTLQNMPFFFYRASGAMPEISVNLKPGEGVPIENPQQDIAFPKWQGSPAWGQQEEAVLMQYAERLTKISDLSVGRQPNRVGATRTAAGTQTLLSESGLGQKGVIQAFQRLWTGVFEDILALDQEYLPPKLEFRVTGRMPTVMRVKDRTEIRGRYDLRIAASSETVNRQKQRDDATLVVQALQNPALMQAGIVGVKGIRRSMEDLLKAFGKDPEFYLEPKAPVRSPIEELMIWVAGGDVDPVQGEDVTLHMQTHQTQLQIPYLDAEIRQKIMVHLQKTQQVAQAMQMAQMLQQQQQKGGGQRPPVGQQAQNAQTGAQPQGAPASPETSPTAGQPMAPA